MTIVEFLTARVDEAQVDAMEAGERNWRFDGTSRSGPKVIVGVNPDDFWMREVSDAVWNCDDELDGCPDSAREWSAEGRHAARYNPAHVLADIAAKRAILSAYQQVTHERPPNDPYQEGMVRGWGDGLDAAIHHIASIYSDHPDYNPDWKP